MRRRFRYWLPCFSSRVVEWVVRMTNSELGSLLGLGDLDATPVGVGDPSFEGNAHGAGGHSDDLSPDWQETGGVGSLSGFEEYITGFSADGAG